MPWVGEVSDSHLEVAPSPLSTPTQPPPGALSLSEGNAAVLETVFVGDCGFIGYSAQSGQTSAECVPREQRLEGPACAILGLRAL